jgi:prevent-host-death family protein
VLVVKVAGGVAARATDRVAVLLVASSLGGRAGTEAAARFESDSLISMRSVSATDAARRFSDVLNAVEIDGESFLVVRHGRPVARIEPATSQQGRAVKSLLRRAPRDRKWLDDVRKARALTQLEERRWRG